MWNLKFQLPSSSCLLFIIFWWFGGKGWWTDWMNEWINQTLSIQLDIEFTSNTFFFNISLQYLVLFCDKKNKIHTYKPLKLFSANCFINFFFRSGKIRFILFQDSWDNNLLILFENCLCYCKAFETTVTNDFNLV